MKRKHYSSADFASVPASLESAPADKLIHQDVLTATAAAHVQDESFSEQRKHLVRVVDLPSKVISMTLGGLEPGQSTRMHRHNYETLIYILEGHGVSHIDGQKVQWTKGDAIYIPVWAWHLHANLSDTEKALYIACENAPLLQNLGVALREEM